jgi:hypothetical protein
MIPSKVKFNFIDLWPRYLRTPRGRIPGPQQRVDSGAIGLMIRKHFVPGQEPKVLTSISEECNGGVRELPRRL